jgi:ParB-like chromosome segregation protein Spo0J
MQIDENLVRSDLNALERGEQFARRKAIYETLHPESKATSPEKQRQRGAGKPAETISAGFTSDTAAKVGVSDRSIRQDIQIAKLPQDLRDVIRDTPLADRKADLLALSRLPDEKQREIVACLKDGRAKKFCEAKAIVCRKPAAKAADDDVSDNPVPPSTDTPEVAHADDQEAVSTTETSHTTSTSAGSPLLSEAAQKFLGNVRAARNFPSMPAGEKLFWLGRVATQFGFADDESAAVAAAMMADDHPVVTESAGYTGFSTSEVKAGILFAAGLSRASNEVRAEILGQEPDQAK